jgi:hypothetical protein
MRQCRAVVSALVFMGASTATDLCHEVSRKVGVKSGSNAAIISTRRVRETVPDLEGAKTGS